MDKEISIIIEYEKSIDIRFFSEFLFHLKACSSYIEHIKYLGFEYRELFKLKKKLEEILKNYGYGRENSYVLEKILVKLDNIYDFEILYSNYRFNTKKYNFFISNTPKIEIQRIEKGSLKLVIVGIVGSILILSSAMAYKIVKSKSVEFEINLPQQIKIKVEDD